MDGSARLHIVMMPGFAGFDALGQLEYYAGVTEVYRRWRAAAPQPVVLHYFPNLPTAGVSTRATWLRSFLAKRIARGEIQGADTIALVGHSTGGLDLRRFCTTAHAARPSSWTRRHESLRRAAVNGLRGAVEGARLGPVETGLSLALGGLRLLDHHPQLFLAAQDALRETRASPDDPTARAEAEEAASQLRLWLRHATDDFDAIDDLAAEPPDGSTSPAHYTLAQRAAERAVWEDKGISTRSFATLGRRPYDLPAGEPAEPWALTDPDTWPNHGLRPGASDVMDVSYLAAYRACAGGPFDHAPEAEGVRVVSDLDTSVYDAGCLGDDGPAPDERIELWDNDGIVNTASMLWPDGPDTRLVAADHGDIIGHYELRANVAAVPSGRRYAAYDLLGSGHCFGEAMFARVWNQVFDFCAGS